MRTISRVVKVAAKDHTLRQIEHCVPLVSKDDIKMRTTNQAVNLVIKGRTTIKLEKSRVANVERASITTNKNRLLNRIVKVVIKASGQTI